MARVAVLLADGFEEIEAVTIIDVLRRAGVDVVTLGVTGEIVHGAHGIDMRADRRFEDGEGEKWDLVVLPGGLPGATNLRDHPGVQELIRKQHEKKRGLGAICAAPIALGAAGVLAGRRATSYPGFEKELAGAEYDPSPVVRDGHIVTSRGIGTALQFALRLVADLEGEEKARELAESMLVTT